MIAAGKTTFIRMRETAYEKMRDIEMSQDARALVDPLSTPHPETVQQRDDFAGIVRLLDVIMMDPDLIEDIKRRMK